MQSLPRPQSWPALCNQPSVQLVDGRKALSPLAGLQHDSSGPRPTAQTASSLGRKQPGHVPHAAPPATASHVSASAPVEQWGQGHDEATILVADIGGTNCRFELWSIPDGSEPKQIIAKTFPTKDYSTFPDAVTALTRLPGFHERSPKSAAFAVAGPVANNRCEMTNLAWVIDGAALSKKYGVRVAVLNDFEANGYGILALKPEDVIVLHDAQPQPKGPIAVLGPGTGLGCANLFWDDNEGATSGYRVFPSEGSHAGFAPRGWRQRALQAFVEQELGRCGVEQVACGSGLERIYRFLQSDEPSNRQGLDFNVIRSAPEITQGALDQTDPLAMEAVDLFLAIIGAEAGYMGLRTLASGGIYVCGGIIPRLLQLVKQGGLEESFLYKKSRFTKLLTTYPLYAVVHASLGLLGTREYATRLLRSPELCKATA